MHAPRIYYLTHPQVEIDPDVPVPSWVLSDEGRRRAATLAGRRFLDHASSVWSSTEPKAVQTAKLLLAGSPLPRLEVEALGENDRSATGFLPPPEFEEVVDEFFKRPGKSVRGWEKAKHAQRRVVAAITDILADPRAGTGDVVVVGHGGVGTLLMTALLDVTIDRALDQPQQGCYFVFDRETLRVRNTWRPLERLR
ncbi:phosphoglycerate mutase family protein [Arsenicicoccus piscis]|uniref:Phosphoglycerate mutase n=1 Tax=Arsenicicoccus piscis TaxID=673954 RepID=A0ABQ6HPG8_9MICO|nr:histidine phosphatase family protein [Arsenicicoccus piscis]MCH8628943.1 phosphoglycerate mutase family protein [Arsenicicoccus piscis]GMA19553.1 phosphoglycerate mutase [Arsenicicoccus piscis]